MLRFLSIEHLAVIDAVQVEFEPGLNVLTARPALENRCSRSGRAFDRGRAAADLIRTGESQASSRPSSTQAPRSSSYAGRLHLRDAVAHMRTTRW